MKVHNNETIEVPIPSALAILIDATLAVHPFSGMNRTAFAFLAIRFALANLGDDSTTGRNRIEWTCTWDDADIPN